MGPPRGLASRREDDHAPGRANGSYDVARVRADFPRSRSRSTASRWSISTTLASAQNAQAVLDRLEPCLYGRICQCARGLHYLANAATGPIGRAREGAGLPQCGADGRDHLHPQRHRSRSTWSPTRSAASASSRATRIVLSIMGQHHSKHRALAFPARAAGRGLIKWAPVDDEEFPHRRIREAPDRPHQDGGDHPYVEHPRHHRAGQGVVRLAHARGIPVLVDGAQGAVHLDRRRPRSRLRLLRRHRAQALRADRHRRALRQAWASGRHAALSMAGAR